MNYIQRDLFGNDIYSYVAGTIDTIKKAKQEYIKVGYPEKTKHIPVVFRVHLREGWGGSIGGSDKTYGWIWLDRHCDLMKEKKENYINYAKEVLNTYFHEFFHTYILKRLIDKEMKDYPKLKYRSKRSWTYNEKIIEIYARIFTNYLRSDKKWIDNWFMLFKDV